MQRQAHDRPEKVISASFKSHKNHFLHR
uniref:Uncharacterized protein n=1 Tax=Rhizophora mucronata TaxID=61149 RepID=A0A2P2PLG7_RHIMU